MVSRLKVAVLGLLASVAVSGVLYLHFGIPAFLVVVPFIPIFAARSNDRPPMKECPACGYRTREPEAQYCPRDGTELQD